MLGPQSRREWDLSGSKQGRLRLIEVEPGLGDREEQAGRTAMRVSEMQSLTQLLALGLDGQHIRHLPLPVLAVGWASLGLACYFSTARAQGSQ